MQSGILGSLTRPWLYPLRCVENIDRLGRDGYLVYNFVFISEIGYKDPMGLFDGIASLSTRAKLVFGAMAVGGTAAGLQVLVNIISPPSAPAPNPATPTPAAMSGTSHIIPLGHPIGLYQVTRPTDIPGGRYITAGSCITGPFSDLAIVGGQISFYADTGNQTYTGRMSSAHLVTLGSRLSNNMVCRASVETGTAPTVAAPDMPPASPDPQTPLSNEFFIANGHVQFRRIPSRYEASVITGEIAGGSCLQAYRTPAGEPVRANGYMHVLAHLPGRILDGWVLEQGDSPVNETGDPARAEQPIINLKRAPVTMTENNCRATVVTPQRQRSLLREPS